MKKVLDKYVGKYVVVFLASSGSQVGKIMKQDRGWVERIKICSGKEKGRIIYYTVWVGDGYEVYDDFNIAITQV